MSRLSFLSEERSQHYLEILTSQAGESPAEAIDRARFSGFDFSQKLSEDLFEQLKKAGDFEAASPIAMGSWARNELCPCSDIDLLFVGDETKGREIIANLQSRGIKIRHRFPEDPTDWTKGVEAFDILALLQARALFKKDQEKLDAQKRLIHSKGKTFLRSLLKRMIEERRNRAQRYDSLSNYLEPNIKYGPGGLRDLQQALYVFELFPDRFEEQGGHARGVFEHYKEYFLRIRQRLHLSIQSEVLIGSEQQAMAESFGFSEIKDFMRDVQVGLARVSFYADWVVGVARNTPKRLREIESVRFKTPSQILYQLESDNSILMQGKVRTHIEEVFSSRRSLSDRGRGRLLNRLLKLDHKEGFFIACFRSRFLEFLVPEFVKVRGLVQHDHYHRLTVDAHLIQCLRELKRVYDSPGVIGKLKNLVQDFTSFDWQVLAWATLYHDLAKGRKGDHSTKGAQLVRKHLAQMGLSKRLSEELEWIVRHHLLLSTAAFRLNSKDPRNWRMLLERGVKGPRLKRLAVFTAVDIRATNIEAWTGWKERLLFELVETMRSPGAHWFQDLLEKAESLQIKVPEGFIKGMDPFLVASVPSRYLVNDFQMMKKSKKDLGFKIVRNKHDETWIRFHRRKDEPGIFLHYVKVLYAAGCPVQMASVRTIEGFGVYDWFRIKTRGQPVPKLKKLIEIVSDQRVEFPRAQFAEISTVSENEDEVILSFRGKDQRGALLSAVQALHDAGLEIRWAKVLTWGRQIDDVFALQKVPDFSERIESVKKICLGESKVVT